MIELDCRESFRKCVLAAYRNRDFVENWERLKGKRLLNPSPSSAIEMMIDDAAGVPVFDEPTLHEFIADVKDLIWDRLSDEAILSLQQEN